MSAPTTAVPRSVQRETNQNVLEGILDASEIAQTERAQELFRKGLIEAFRRVNQGFSLDRVIADPDLNAALKDECTRMGLPGDIRWWNRNLFRARKAGALANISAGRRTEYSWQTCDSFLFASEIAWRKLLDRGFNSLDEILCDPDTAAEFDHVASALAPGFTPLEYRWGALKLRKESKRARARAGVLATARFREPFSKSVKVTSGLARIPNVSGIYVVFDAAADRPLYAGETLTLKSRLTHHFEGGALAVWKEYAPDFAIRYYTADPDIPLLLAYQSLSVRRYQPTLNIPEPAFA
jgi:site-specific DNA-methyltransferase (adenine-specific)